MRRRCRGRIAAAAVSRSRRNLTSMIASKGIANIPSGGLIALATVLTAIGLPVEAIAIVAGVDVFMDMGRTTLNVFGNTVAVKLVQKLGGLGATDTPDTISVGPALENGVGTVTSP